MRIKHDVLIEAVSNWFADAQCYELRPKNGEPTFEAALVDNNKNLFLVEFSIEFRVKCIYTCDDEYEFELDWNVANVELDENIVGLRIFPKIPPEKWLGNNKFEDVEGRYDYSFIDAYHNAVKKSNSLYK